MVHYVVAALGVIPFLNPQSTYNNNNYYILYYELSYITYNSILYKLYYSTNLLILLSLSTKNCIDQTY